MNPEEQEHTFWYEQDIYGNIYRIDWYINTSGLESTFHGHVDDFKDTLKWIKQLPEVKK